LFKDHVKAPQGQLTTRFDKMTRKYGNSTVSTISKTTFIFDLQI